MLVNEVARRAGIPSHVVRYYARIGLLAPRRNPDNGYKLFSKDDVARVQLVRDAQEVGLTLEEIRRFLGVEDKGTDACCTRQRDALETRLVKTREAIAELRALEQRIQVALARWPGPGSCDPEDAYHCPAVQFWCEE